MIKVISILPLQVLGALHEEMCVFLCCNIGK